MDPGLRPIGDFDILVPMPARTRAFGPLAGPMVGARPSGSKRSASVRYTPAISHGPDVPSFCDLYLHLLEGLAFPMTNRSPDDLWAAPSARRPPAFDHSSSAPLISSLTSLSVDPGAST